MSQNVWAINIDFQILAKDPELSLIFHYFYHKEMKGFWIFIWLMRVIVRVIHIVQMY